MPRLKNDDQNRILGLFQGGISQITLARRFKMHRSTISRLIQQFNVTGSVSDRMRPGAVRASTLPQDVYIRQCYFRNSFVTASSTAGVVRC
jgi:transposase